MQKKTGSEIPNERQRDLIELMTLRDETRRLKTEKQELQHHIDMINSSRLYRLLRTTTDAKASRKGLVETARECGRIIRQKHGTKAGRKEEPAPGKHGYQDIARAAREHGKPLPEGSGDPLVSVIILTRNGMDNLTRLFDSLKQARHYRNYEIIVIDNASDDQTREYLNSLEEDFRLKILRNEENVSFSEGCNQGAEAAAGEYLLFLNNDIEALDYWLDEMLRAALEHKDAGAVGARLVYPKIPSASINRGKSYLVQHAGICFSPEIVPDYGWLYRPRNIQGMDALEEPFSGARPIGAVTAACMLLKKDAFQAVGGFDENYHYGYEDVDLCLKLIRAGYVNYYCPSAVLFHYEFGTQAADSPEIVRERRIRNRDYYNKRWQQWLGRRYVEDKAAGNGWFSRDQLTIAFAVTETGENAVAGDYFTAMELGKALETYGYRIKYLTRVSGAWYNVGTDVDIVVSMLQHFDPSQIYNAAPHLVTIAWARNWFTSWIDVPFIQDYSILLASSRSACRYMEKKLQRKVYLLPIATNDERFDDRKNGKRKGNAKEQAFFECDYCFTGNYFDQEREIETELHPETIPYRFKVFGKRWDKTDTFASYCMGHIPYRDIPKVYQYTKVVLDDATPSTKRLGAINSRVYDALAAGCLVLTNNTHGAEETFEGKLPSFHDEESLRNLLLEYLGDEAKRIRKTAELQDFIREKHTYTVRAAELRKIIAEGLKENEESATILICAPNWRTAVNWGDYYFAASLRNTLEKKGIRTDIRVQTEWYKPFRNRYIIMLRGTTPFVPNASCKCALWNISHPEDVTGNELKAYDVVFTASDKVAREWSEAGIRTEYLPQCTDPAVFDVGETAEKEEDLLFVGNTRDCFRQIIRDLLPTEYNLSVYGKGWEEFIDEKMIKGDFVPNELLAGVYQKTRILLNDHWDDMKTDGFVSNRIYDALAAGTFVISDKVSCMDPELETCIETYETPEELKAKIKYYLDHPDAREETAARGKKLVLSKHTFDVRADKLLNELRQGNPLRL